MEDFIHVIQDNSFAIGESYNCPHASEVMVENIVK